MPRPITRALRWVTNNGNPITLVVGTNTIPVEVTAADGTTKITYTVTITRSPSSDATLSNLISSIGTLTPRLRAGHDGLYPGG